MNVPKRLVRVQGNRCRQVGQLAAGRTARVNFKVRARPNARIGARPTIKMIASANSLNNRNNKARVKITR